MGKKKRRKQLKDDGVNHRGPRGTEEINFAIKNDTSEDFSSRKSAKQMSRLRKKLKRKVKEELKMVSKKKNDEVRAHYKGWHMIRVIGGADLDRTFLLSSIGNYVDVPFCPLGYSKIETTSCFYLEANAPAAEAIGGLDKRLQGPDGKRLKIVVTLSEVPDLVLNSDQLQILREVMARRFDSTSSLLDLTSLHNDPVLLEKEILSPIASVAIMKQVLRIIRENIPQLKALNLSSNNLKYGHLKVLTSLSECVHLTALNLENNNIASSNLFKLVKIFPLIELNLESNPILQEFKSPLKYIQTARKDLPNLQILDKVVIDTYLMENPEPSQVSHILPHRINNMSIKQNTISDTTENTISDTTGAAMSEALVRTFLEQYYGLIDSPERVSLIAAYTPMARLEIKSSISSLSGSTFEGQASISKALAAFPATQHDHSTFSLRILSITNALGKVQVTGKIKLEGLESPVSFSRVMTIVPFNSGLCCSADLLELC